MTDNQENNKKRWLALALISIYVSGSYWCIHNPSVLETSIMETFDVSKTKYSELFASYSIANLIVPLFGGILIDKLGYAKGLMSATFLTMVGQTMIAFGVMFRQFWMMVIGRVMFGVFTELLWIVEMVDLANWFIDKEHTLAVGIS